MRNCTSVLLVCIFLFSYSVESVGEKNSGHRVSRVSALRRFWESLSHKKSSPKVHEAASWSKKGASPTLQPSSREGASQEKLPLRKTKPAVQKSEEGLSRIRRWMNSLKGYWKRGRRTSETPKVDQARPAAQAVADRHSAKMAKDEADKAREKTAPALPVPEPPLLAPGVSSPQIQKSSGETFSQMIARAQKEKASRRSIAIPTQQPATGVALQKQGTSSDGGLLWERLSQRRRRMRFDEDVDEDVQEKESEMALSGQPVLQKEQPQQRMRSAVPIAPIKTLGPPKAPPLSPRVVSSRVPHVQAESLTQRIQQAQKERGERLAQSKPRITEVSKVTTRQSPRDMSSLLQKALAEKKVEVEHEEDRIPEILLDPNINQGNNLTFDEYRDQDGSVYIKYEGSLNENEEVLSVKILQAIQKEFPYIQSVILEEDEW